MGIANSSKPAPNLQVESHQIRTLLIIGNHKHVVRHAFRAIYQRFATLSVSHSGKAIYVRKNFRNLPAVKNRMDRIALYERAVFQVAWYKIIRIVIK